jgi:hypothetical protein
MVTIGLISEGPTDQVILKHLIARVAGDDFPIIQDLQPRIDPDQPNAVVPGGWGQIFAYFERENIAAALKTNPSLHLIIQIDSDVFASQEIPEAYRFAFNKADGTRLSVPETITAISEKLTEAMGADVVADYPDRILFAIAVDASECWLLPFYYDNKQASKTTGCLPALNKQLSAKYKFTIAGKNLEYYRTACKPILKDKRFDRKYPKNESLKIFMERLKQLPFEEE